MNNKLLGENLNFNQIFFIVFIPALVSGPLIPELLIFILIIYYFYKNRQFSNLTKNFKLFSIFLMTFYVYLNLNTFFFSFDFNVSIKSTLPYIRLILFSLIVGKILIEDENKILGKLLVYSSLVLLFILLFDSLIQLKTGQNIFGHKYSNGRISSLFGSEEIMGSFVIKVLPLIFCFLYLTNLKSISFYKIIFLVITIVLIILSSERVALAHYILILFLILFIETKNIKYFIISIFSLFFLIIIGLNIYAPAKERVMNATLNQLKSSTTLFAPSYRHEMHYFTAFYIFLDDPIFGKGLKSFRHECGNYESHMKNKINKDKAIYAPYDGIAKLVDVNFFTTGKKQLIRFFKYNYSLGKQENTIYETYYFNDNYKKFSSKLDTNTLIKKGEFILATNEYSNGCNTHPHNYLLQFLSEIGIIGFLFYFIFFVYLLTGFFKIILLKFSHYKLQNLQKAIFIMMGSILIELLPILPSGNFFNNWLSMIFFFKIGVIFFLIQNNKSNNLS